MLTSGLDVTFAASADPTQRRYSLGWRRARPR